MTIDEAATEPGASVRPRTDRRSTSIVPQQNVAGSALVWVISIMTFLSCLMFGGVTLIRDAANVWQSQISREATIQIKPAEGLDIEAELAQAATIASGFRGVKNATPIDRAATARLLEPWLGSGLDIDELPVPRLVVVTIDETDPPDFAQLRNALATEVPTASLDDHRSWVDRLVAMSRTTVTIGIGVLGLMLSATVLCVVFATRGAMAGNGHIIEVLHFVGAEARFIAAEFRRHFLTTGAKGAAAGGMAAVVVFIASSWWSSASVAMPERDQAVALFGSFSIGIAGYAGVVVIAAFVALLTAITSHLTVTTHLTDLDTRQHEG